MKREIRYHNIFRFGTLQYGGHLNEYFNRHSQKAVTFYILPRGGVKNFIEFYTDGKLIEKKELFSPKNIVLAYFSYYFQFIYLLFYYFSPKEKIYIINSLPIFFFFNSFWRLFRNFEIVYWVQDFWPMNHPVINIFRSVMYFYHHRTKKTIYVTDRINKIMNDKIIESSLKKTIMLGMKMPKIQIKQPPKKKLILCFIGVLKRNQGLEIILPMIKKDNNLSLNLIGTGEKEVITYVKNFIKKNNLEKRIYFPNTFLYGKELLAKVKTSHIGIALYENDKNSVTFFADPAKLKQYIEFGLPVITTNLPEISVMIKKFGAGEIVERNEVSILKAISKIRDNYELYLKGLSKFSRNFYFEDYYLKKFKFLETGSSH